MDFGQLAQSLWTQLVTAWNAPAPFLAALLASWCVIRWHIRGRYETRLANAESTIQLLERQLQEYKDKLSGATPDEAKARLQALENRLDSLTPRRVSAEQRQRMTAVLDRCRGSSLDITIDGVSPDATQLGQGLETAFNGAGWIVHKGTAFGIGRPPASGIGLVVSQPSALTDQQQCIADAFREAGLAFDLQAGAAPYRHPSDPRPLPAATVVLTSSLD